MERRAIAIFGIVQGVGFRPFVFDLASRLGVGGFVRNSTGGVRIEVQGPQAQLDRFVGALRSEAPPLARIERLICEARPVQKDDGFRIETSLVEPAGPVMFSPDSATCDACLKELFDPTDRRYRYPFLNCTNCGPRLTIVRGAPYDRHRSTMSGFEMCATCRAEYENPRDRRFHAQPTCCAACGPQLMPHNADGEPVDVDDPLKWFEEALRGGRIGAIKGLGGYHLACDARRQETIAELRHRKHRDEKPFAIMVADLPAARQFCEISDAEAALLTSIRRPIVLLRKKERIELADNLAPENPMLGIMLPYTPLHHLLLRDLDGMPLVMTSGNRSDEPIATSEPEVFQRLREIADLFLTHNRPIHVRCDDSVTRVIDGMESPLRRSRGCAPQPIALPAPCAIPILAVGGQLKGTFALGRGGHAIVSHHLGDLDQMTAYQAFEKDIALYEKLFEIRPRAIACDLHPDYASTRYARKRAAAEGLRLFSVQHHHAHLASAMCEHGLTDPVIGVCFDGTGYGTDGAIWGGEFLIGDLRGFQRAAHLRYVPMPGGDRAIKEPWRMALAHLTDAQVECPPALRRRLDPEAIRIVKTMLRRRLNSPMTSSAGRLFDAVASLAGVRDRISYEGQAAMQLESLARDQDAAAAYPFELITTAEPADDQAPAPIQIDTRPLIAAVAADVCAGACAEVISSRFHAAIIDLIVEVCLRLRRPDLNQVVLSGGVFMNARLAWGAVRKLGKYGFSTFRHCTVPPNDGGVSLGQLAVAAARANA